MDEDQADAFTQELGERMHAYVQDNLAGPLDTTARSLQRAATGAGPQHQQVADAATALSGIAEVLPAWVQVQSVGGPQAMSSGSLVPAHVRQAVAAADKLAQHYSSFGGAGHDVAASAANAATQLKVVNEALSDDALDENVLFPSLERHLQ
jgi:hypothetical protein